MGNGGEEEEGTSGTLFSCKLSLRPDRLTAPSMIPHKTEWPLSTFSSSLKRGPEEREVDERVKYHAGSLIGDSGFPKTQSHQGGFEQRTGRTGGGEAEMGNAAQNQHLPQLRPPYVTVERGKERSLASQFKP